MPDWKERRVLIVGGSAGFGKALAMAALARGAETFVGARDREKLEAFAREARIAFPVAKLHVRPVDALDSASLDAWFAEVEAGAPGLDLVVCVVGRSERGRILDATPDRLIDAFRINVVPALLTAQRAAKALASRKGTFVAIGSLASKLASPYLGAYPPAKFALAGLTQQLRWELEPLGVKTLFVAPGPMERDDAGTRYDDQAANLPEAARRPGAGAPLRPLSMVDLADEVFRSVERGDLELTVPGKARWIFAIWQVAPAWAKWFLARQWNRGEE